jgi:hypothetical protein
MLLGYGSILAAEENRLLRRCITQEPRCTFKGIVGVPLKYVAAASR